MERKPLVKAAAAVTLLTVSWIGGSWTYRCLSAQEEACLKWAENRGAAFQSGNNNPTPDNLNNPTIVDESIPAQQLPVNTHLIDPQTNTSFEVVYYDNKKCIRLSKFTSSNLQDVYRAALNLGPDQTNYTDHYNFSVYSPYLTPLGSFTSDIPPADLNNFDIVDIGTLICES